MSRKFRLRSRARSRTFPPAACSVRHKIIRSFNSNSEIVGVNSFKMIIDFLQVDDDTFINMPKLDKLYRKGIFANKVMIVLIKNFLVVFFIITSTLWYNNQNAICSITTLWIQCCHAECHIFLRTLRFFMLNVIMSSVALPS